MSLKSKSLERLLNISKNSFVRLNNICFSEAVGEQRIFFFPPDFAVTFFTLTLTPGLGRPVVSKPDLEFC